MKKLVFLALMLLSSSSYSTKITTCFTPGENCEDIIVNAINSAKEYIHMQAYSFTDRKIANALVNAKSRNLKVFVILDKSQFYSKKSCASYLEANNVVVYDDFKAKIAHNKVIIIDDKSVITGSYNYTVDAQTRNAENVVIIEDPDIVAKYFNNWLERMKLSKLIIPVF